MTARTPNPFECKCGYPGTSDQDLAEHILASARINDGEHHGYAN